MRRPQGLSGASVIPCVLGKTRSGIQGACLSGTDARRTGDNEGRNGVDRYIKTVGTGTASRIGDGYLIASCCVDTDGLTGAAIAPEVLGKSGAGIQYRGFTAANTGNSRYGSHRIWFYPLGGFSLPLCNRLHR